MAATKMTFALGASSPLQPSLMPRLVDPLWLRVDVPRDENSELTKMEKEHHEWLKSLGERDLGLLPIGKTTPETDDDEEEDDEEEGEGDDSVSHDDEDDEMDMNFGGTQDRGNEGS